MTPAIRRYLPCTLVVNMHPVEPGETAIPVDFRFQIPSVGWDISMSAFVPRDGFKEARDPEEYVLGLGKTLINHALEHAMRSAGHHNLAPPDRPVIYPPASPDAPDDPHARVAKLESALADLARKYDALVLKRMGISYDKG